MPSVRNSPLLPIFLIVAVDVLGLTIAAGLSFTSIMATLTLLPNGVKPPPGNRKHSLLPFKDIRDFARDPKVARLMAQST